MCAHAVFFRRTEVNLQTVASETNRNKSASHCSTPVEQPSPGMHSRLFMKAKPWSVNVPFHWHRSPKSLKRLEWGTLDICDRLSLDENLGAMNSFDQNEFDICFPVFFKFSFFGLTELFR